MIQNYPRTMYADSDGDQAHYSLRLYVTGRNEKSIAARQNLRRVCEMYLAERYDIEVIDLAENPRRAAEDGIIRTPTLVRRTPRPVKRIAGDLSNTDKLLASLGIVKRSGSS
jgi:circadian clock protein KaiB